MINRIICFLLTLTIIFISSPLVMADSLDKFEVPEDAKQLVPRYQGGQFQTGAGSNPWERIPTSGLSFTTVDYHRTLRARYYFDFLDNANGQRVNISSGYTYYITFHFVNSSDNTDTDLGYVLNGVYGNSKEDFLSVDDMPSQKEPTKSFLGQYTVFTSQSHPITRYDVILHMRENDPDFAQLVFQIYHAPAPLDYTYKISGISIKAYSDFDETVYYSLVNKRLEEILSAIENNTSSITSSIDSNFSSLNNSLSGYFTHLENSIDSSLDVFCNNILEYLSVPINRNLGGIYSVSTQIKSLLEQLVDDMTDDSIGSPDSNLSGSIGNMENLENQVNQSISNNSVTMPDGSTLQINANNIASVKTLITNYYHAPGYDANASYIITNIWDTFMPYVGIPVFFALFLGVIIFFLTGRRARDA